MGLFDKKYCDICGEKISLLGNRKLDDGNMCSKCAKGISPFFTGRRHTSLSAMKEHLAYREENKQKLSTFNASAVLGDGTKVYYDSSKSAFVVSSLSPQNWDKENPDVIPTGEVVSCNLDIKENRQEEYMRDQQGNRTSYSPPRYKYDYDFYIKIQLSSKWFDEIEFKLNTFDVEDFHSQRYHNFEVMGHEIVSLLTGNTATFSQGRGYGAGETISSTYPGGFVGGVANAFVNQVAQNAQNGVRAPYEEGGFGTAERANSYQSEIDNAKRRALQELQTTGVPNGQQMICPNCKSTVSGNFCPNCGAQTDAPMKIRCAKCGYDVPMSGIIPKFCPGCGDPIDIDDMI